MTFNDSEATFTTYDGLPVSEEPPHGASVVVRAQSPDGWRYLVLHRSHNGPDYEGEWAWTPPAGARFPGEGIEACAKRELEEETGLKGQVRALRVENIDWAVFALEIPWQSEISLNDEHDRFEWLTLDDACARCLPRVVSESFGLAAAPREGG